MVVHKNSVVCVNKAGLVADSPTFHVFWYVENPLKSHFSLDRYHCSTIDIIVTIQIHPL